MAGQAPRPASARITSLHPAGQYRCPDPGTRDHDLWLHRARRSGRRRAVPKLIILYGPPSDPAAFEDYYARRHIPHASRRSAASLADSARATARASNPPSLPPA